MFGRKLSRVEVCFLIGGVQLAAMSATIVAGLTIGIIVGIKY